MYFAHTEDNHNHSFSMISFWQEFIQICFLKKTNVAKNCTYINIKIGFFSSWQRRSHPRFDSDKYLHRSDFQKTIKELSYINYPIIWVKKINGTIMIVKKWLFIINQKVLYYIIDLITFQTAILRFFLIIMSYRSHNLFSKKCNPINRTKHFSSKWRKDLHLLKKSYQTKQAEMFLILHCFFARLCKSCFRKRRVVFEREEKRRAAPSRAQASTGEPGRVHLPNI